MDCHRVGRDADLVMVKPFSLPFKQKMIERLTGANAVSANRLAHETGLRQQTLSRWLNEARRLPDVVAKKRDGKTWTIDDKIRVLAAAASVSGPQLTALLEREGLALAELEQWRLSLGDITSSVATTKRIRKLERELARKEKALAEAAALLVLKKKVEHLWEDEGDDTDRESDR